MISLSELSNENIGIRNRLSFIFKLTRNFKIDKYKNKFWIILKSNLIKSPGNLIMAEKLGKPTKPMI